MLHMTTTTGEKTFQTSENPATAECNMSGCMGDTSLRGSHLSVPTDLMDRIDTREISNIPTTRNLPVLNLETEEAMGTCSAC
ncbi:hypothetical protein TNCV_4355051 [Trichonephila clavipes]|nr:hypothetical protein TNCV_4355051 [Trichonephila clavipes]